MKMKTCDCGTKMLYNMHYHFYECSNCEKCYNAAGQPLAPLADWKSEYDEGDY
jgi:ssDNA-binding Zn-finger/Zn-ribbon topoisomerase 1